MTDEHFIRRCFELAQKGAGSVAPNPMVGAVLVHQNRIIGEGWHEKYGAAHAEVNCFRSVAMADEPLVPFSTLFCSLEPCHHTGKTPPCVDLVLAKKVQKIVISNADPNPLTAGKSIQKLREAGAEVLENVLEREGRQVNRTFFHWMHHDGRRPFVILKWAESADGFLGRTGERTAISGAFAQRLAHRWRSETAAILVGTTTVLVDEPSLTTRLYFGKNPARLLVDFEGKVPPTAPIFSADAQTFVLNKASEPLIEQVFALCAHRNFQTLMIEGGAKVLQQFIDAGAWDEARIFVAPRTLGSGVAAPQLLGAKLSASEKVGDDLLRTFEPLFEPSLD